MPRSTVSPRLPNSPPPHTGLVLLIASGDRDTDDDVVVDAVTAPTTEIDATDAATIANVQGRRCRIAHPDQQPVHSSPHIHAPPQIKYRPTRGQHDAHERQLAALPLIATVLFMRCRLR